jgi:hypothetical protein
MGLHGLLQGKVRKADLTTICEPIVYKMWEPRRLITLWASMACYRDRLVRKADNLTTICEPIVYKMWEPRRLAYEISFLSVCLCVPPNFSVFCAVRVVSMESRRLISSSQNSICPLLYSVE